MVSQKKTKWSLLASAVQTSERYLQVKRRGAWSTDGENHAVAVYEPFVCTLAEALAPLHVKVTQSNSDLL